jgi:hypothetical protein
MTHPVRDRTWPDLFIAEIQVFVIQPVSAGECVQYSTAVQLAGAPELNRRMVSQSVGSVGPAGMLLADDTETLIWLPEGHLTQLLDPSADRWRDA